MDDAPVDARTVAEAVLWIRRDVQTTPMHIIKLVYLSHGWMLGLYDTPLLWEPVEAWQYGPVVPSVYHLYKGWGGAPITAVPVDRSADLSERQREVIEEVEQAYHEYTALQLSNITHKPGSPWDSVCRQSGVGAIIPNEVLREYYRRLAEQAA